MKKKLFLAFLAMLGIAMQVSAQWEKERSVTTVVLWAEDGTSAEYKCSDRPVVHHDGNEWVQGWHHYRKSCRWTLRG